MDKDEQEGLSGCRGALIEVQMIPPLKSPLPCDEKWTVDLVGTQEK